MNRPLINKFCCVAFLITEEKIEQTEQFVFFDFNALTFSIETLCRYLKNKKIFSLPKKCLLFVLNIFNAKCKKYTKSKIFLWQKKEKNGEN